MKRLSILIFVLLQGCMVTPAALAPTVEQDYDNAACPPLPQLPPGATRTEERLNNAVVRELYAQCAESKK